MENLPAEIIENILFRLPSEVVLQHAKRVCTTWKALLSNYKFDKPGILFAIGKLGIDGHGQLLYGDEHEHYDHTNKNYYRTRGTLARMEPHEFRMRKIKRDFLVGSCNGLLCLRKRYKKDGGLDSFEVCNPLTGDYVSLPRLARGEEINYHQLASGFGYCHSTEEYKVVTMYEQKNNGAGYVKVYTVGGKYWRNKSIPNPNAYFLKGSSSGFCANGGLHWLQYNFDNWLTEILAFNLEDEEFHSIPLPESLNSEDTSKLFGDLNAFYFVHTDPRTHSMDIWAYKPVIPTSKQKLNYGDTKAWSWIREFSINCDWQVYKPFTVTRNREVLLWYENQILCCYDPKTCTLNKLWRNNKLECAYVEAISHMHSTVSLNDLGETTVRNYKATTSVATEKRKVIDGGNSISPERSVRSRGAKRS